MTRLTRMLDAGDEVSDEALLEELKENKFPIEEEFFRKCLTGRLPKSAKYLIQTDQDQKHSGKCLSNAEMPSIIFEIKEEEVIIKIMRTYAQSSWKSHSVIPETEENLLHFFISKGFYRALLDTLDNETIQEDIRELCFQPNKARQIPLMALLSQDMEESALKLWTFMEKSGAIVDKGTSEIDHEAENVLNMIDSREDNIFHISSVNGQNQVLSALCMSTKVSRRCIQDGLLQRNLNGRTALDLCDHEETILKILDGFDQNSHKLTSIDAEGKNILHHYARKDFSEAIEKLIRKLPPVEIRDMILQESSSNGSNVLMTSAIHSSNKTLELLLHFLSVFQLFPVDNETLNMDRILHHRNAYGNTLLSLVLQHKDALQVPKIILLGMEIKFHSGDGREDELVCCFHQNLKPSGDVLTAIQEVEKTNKKGTVAIVWIWIQSFLKAFLIPVGIMAMDIIFDVFLVKEYFYTNPDCLSLQWQICHSFSNETIFDTSCGTNSTDRVPQGDGGGFFCVPNDGCNVSYVLQGTRAQDLNIFCIPLKLDANPRFFYSLGFVVWPWVYYLVEFLQSDVFASMSEVNVRPYPNH